MNDAVNNDELTKSDSVEIDSFQPNMEDLIKPETRPDEVVNEIKWRQWVPFFIPSANKTGTMFWVAIAKYAKTGNYFFIGVDDKENPKPICKFSALSNKYGTDNSVTLDQYTFSAQAELDGSSLVVKASYKNPAGKTFPIDKTFTVE